jgi:hypothetical protein
MALIERTFASAGADYDIVGAKNWLQSLAPLSNDYDFYQIGQDAIPNNWGANTLDFNDHKVRFINEEGHKILCTGANGQIDLRGNNTGAEHFLDLIGLFLEATATSVAFLIEAGGWNVANDTMRIIIKDCLIKGHTSRNSGIKFHGTRSYVDAFNIKLWNMKTAVYCSVGGSVTPYIDRRFLENISVYRSDNASYFFSNTVGNEWQLKNCFAVDPVTGSLFENVGDGTQFIKVFNSASSPGTDQVQGVNVKQNIVTLDNIISLDDTSEDFLKLKVDPIPGLPGAPDLGASGVAPSIVDNTTDISGNSRPDEYGFYSIGAEEQQYTPAPEPIPVPEEMPDQADLVDLKLTKDTHDIYLSSGDLAIVDGEDELVQRVKIKLLFFFGEWFLDTSLGIKYYESILKKNPDLNLVDSIIKASILDEPEMIDFIEYSSDFDISKREFSVNFIANTTYGQITFNEEIL